MPQTPTTPFTFRLTPNGIVLPQGASAGDPWADKLLQSFARHECEGLLALAVTALPSQANVSALFWREISSQLLTALCHWPEGEALVPEELERPSEEKIQGWLNNAPPMDGAEYLSGAVLEQLWNRQLQWLAGELKAFPSLSAFLQDRAPSWSRVGRVTLHLAENKDDPDYPFAFMATYSTGLSQNGRLKRQTLGLALQEYAGAKQKTELLKLLQPLNEAARHCPWMAELMETGDVFHPLVWTVAETYQFFRQIPVYEKSGLLVQVPNWWRKRVQPRVNVSVDVKPKSNVGLAALLQFNISMALGAEALSSEELQQCLDSGTGLIRLRGQWVEVDAEKLQQVLAHWKNVQRRSGKDGMSFIEGMRHLAGASADLSGEVDLSDECAQWSQIHAGGQLKQALKELRAPHNLAGGQPEGLQGQLRHYQSEGLNWLWLCYQLGLGACLADDMGLGKTLQVLALLLRHKNSQREPAKSKKTTSSTQLQKPSSRVHTPSLLIVPTSLMGNWKAEAQKFSPDLRVIILHPSECPKDEWQEYQKSIHSILEHSDLVICTYGLLSRLKNLAEVTWQWLILDEAQAIKNPTSNQSKAVKQIPSQGRIALTGTPVENRLGDLWSIFDFLNPGLLGSAKKFKDFAKSLQKEDHVNYAPLRQLIAPYILRRMKNDPRIAPDLPEKTEMQVLCSLVKSQAVLYQKNVLELTQALGKTEGDPLKRRGLVLKHLMQLKQICNHPSQYTGDGEYGKDASGKFLRLREICEEVASRGEKVLIFTQFREILEALSELVSECFSRPVLTLHGGTPAAQRKNLVADFQREDGPPAFLLSLKAGGTGLNLTAASQVIHFDRWWNPAIENQATDRAFRIGQKRNVLVHKFVTRGTVEDRINELLNSKQTMVNALLKEGAEPALTEMSNDEILRMVALDIDKAME
jgi:superfamily II DNA or RNA helicase